MEGWKECGERLAGGSFLLWLCENGSMTLQRMLTIQTREEAAQADRQANWAKTPQERLAEVEFLRQQRYPHGIAPRLQRTIEFVEINNRGERSEPEQSEQR